MENELEILRAQAELQSDFTEDNHDSTRENLKLRVERDQVKDLLDKTLKKLDKRKLTQDKLEADIRTLRESKASLEDQLRSLTREKSDDKDALVRESEAKLRLQSEKVELETRLASLIKDNQTLEASLKELSKGGGVSSSEIDMNVKILVLEKERDLLKWNQERQELEAKVNEYKQLVQSKDAEYQAKQKRGEDKFKDEILSIEEDYKEQIAFLQDQVLD